MIAKISNNNRIRNRMNILFILISLLAILLIGTFLIPHSESSKVVIRIAVSVALVILLLIFWSLKCICYEHSGELITIKTFHPLKSNGIIIPAIEFPKALLKDYTLDKYLNGYWLHIKLITENGNIISKHYTLQGFKTKQIIQMMGSLEKTKQENL